MQKNWLRAFTYLRSVQCSKPRKVILMATSYSLVVLTANASGVDLPSAPDGTSSMTAAATILRLADTALFQWISRFLSAIAIWGVAISIKDMRYGAAFLALLAAFLFAAAPSLVTNIFTVSGGSTLFSN